MPYGATTPYTHSPSSNLGSNNVTELPKNIRKKRKSAPSTPTSADALHTYDPSSTSTIDGIVASPKPKKRIRTHVRNDSGLSDVATLPNLNINSIDNSCGLPNNSGTNYANPIKSRKSSSTRARKTDIKQLALDEEAYMRMMEVLEMEEDIHKLQEEIDKLEETKRVMRKDFSFLSEVPIQQAPQIVEDGPQRQFSNQNGNDSQEPIGLNTNLQRALLGASDAILRSQHGYAPITGKLVENSNRGFLNAAPFVTQNQQHVRYAHPSRPISFTSKMAASPPTQHVPNMNAHGAPPLSVINPALHQEPRSPFFTTTTDPHSAFPPDGTSATQMHWQPSNSLRYTTYHPPALSPPPTSPTLSPSSPPATSPPNSPQYNPPQTTSYEPYQPRPLSITHSPASTVPVPALVLPSTLALQPHKLPVTAKFIAQSSKTPTIPPHSKLIVTGSPIPYPSNLTPTVPPQISLHPAPMTLKVAPIGRPLPTPTPPTSLQSHSLKIQPQPKQVLQMKYAASTPPKNLSTLPPNTPTAKYSSVTPKSTHNSTPLPLVDTTALPTTPLPAPSISPAPTPST